MQNFTMHCHTNFLNIFDGRNSAEEMISEAEKKGFSKIGISNHLCYHYNQEQASPMLMNDFSKALEIYQQNSAHIREVAKRHPKIKVCLGYEVDFFPSNRWRKEFEKMISMLDYDYLIGSVHNVCSSDGEQVVNLYDVFFHKHIQKAHLVKEYFPNVYKTQVESIKSGYFDLIAHLDVYKIFNLGIEEEWNSEKEKVIETLAKFGQPTELNTSGWNKCGEQHPDIKTLEKLNKNAVPLIISDDAHNVERIGENFERAEKLLNDINYINRWNFE